MKWLVKAGETGGCAQSVTCQLLHNNGKHFPSFISLQPALLLVLYSGSFVNGKLYDFYCLACKCFFHHQLTLILYLLLKSHIGKSKQKALRTSFSRCDWPCSTQGLVSFALAPDKSPRRFFKSIDWGRCSWTLESLLKCSVVIQGWGRGICLVCVCVCVFNG